MERLNWHAAAELARVADVRVVGPAGAAVLAPPGVAVHEVPLTPLPRFLVQALFKACREARAWKPDVVVAGSGLTAPIAYAAARAGAARSAAYVHGLDVVVPNVVYRTLWWPILRRVDRLIANSGATASLCGDIGVDVRRIGIVHPGVALPDAPPDESLVDRFRSQHGLAGRRLLLSVGRLTDRKGLREFVTHALPRIVATVPDATLVVVGDAPSHALHAKGQSRESIETAALQAGVSDHVLFTGVVTDSELAIIYGAASVHVFPVRELPGDPEGFGMVAVEAAATGLPTVAFTSGGVRDAVGHEASGYLVPSGEYEAFADAVVRVLTTGRPDRNSCKSFARKFAWTSFGEQLARELRLAPRQADGDSDG
ncbi:glycosyltransferase family 4 protein [Lysobacter claricitrinus]|uniref:glycosyltransferase family 4 protein n=1 Tax=Lysobacter claricitrinus TaxID=3367728 RepID=UPI0037DB46AD